MPYLPLDSPTFFHSLHAESGGKFWLENGSYSAILWLLVMVKGVQEDPP